MGADEQIDRYGGRLPKKALEARQYFPVIKSNHSKAALYEIDFTGLHTVKTKMSHVIMKNTLCV